MTLPAPRPSRHLLIPPPLWGMAMLLLAYGADLLLASTVVFRSTPLAVLIGAGGSLLSGWGERTFAAEGTDILPASPTNKKLVTRGPFRYTRNPMYLGLVLMASGFAFYFGTIPFYAVPVLLFLLCNFSFIPFEEAAAPVRRSVHGLPPPRATVDMKEFASDGL